MSELAQKDPVTHTAHQHGFESGLPPPVVKAARLESDIMTQKQLTLTLNTLKSSFYDNLTPLHPPLRLSTVRLPRHRCLCRRLHAAWLTMAPGPRRSQTTRNPPPTTRGGATGGRGGRREQTRHVRLLFAPRDHIVICFRAYLLHLLLGVGYTVATLQILKSSVQSLAMRAISMFVETW